MKDTKKGFLFVVTIFLILSYILLSISVWVKSIESSERIYSEFYKESTVELAIEQITEEKVDNVSYRIMSRAISRVNDESVFNPVLSGETEELSNLEAAMNELLVDGSADSGYFLYDGLDEENSSMTSWVQNLNVSLLGIGIYIDEFYISDFEIYQTDIDLVRYSFNMHLSMRDTGGRTTVFRDYDISNELDITGLVDPAIVRGSYLATSTPGENMIYRHFFFAKDTYSEPTDLEPDELSGYTVHGGQGWFYGYLTTDASMDSALRHRYVFVGTYEDILAADPFQEFGAYIVTSAPGSSGTCGTNENQEDTFNAVRFDGVACDEASFDYGAGEYTEKPFIEAEGFDITSAPSCPRLDEDDSPARCALIVAAHSPGEVLDDAELKLSRDAGIYDVEDMRDFIMCGYYIHNPAAPSYLQRLLDGSYSRSSEDFGIETFVIGEYANHDDFDRYSRLDRELFNATHLEAYGVRGMPGCKQFEHCADSPSTGVFTVSGETADDYGLGDIFCEGVEGCDE